MVFLKTTLFSRRFFPKLLCETIPARIRTQKFIASALAQGKEWHFASMAMGNQQILLLSLKNTQVPNSGFMHLISPFTEKQNGKRV